MSVALAHRFNVQEYFRMAETGILPPEARVELIEGEIIDMLPIGPFHSGVLNQLTREFSNLAGGRWLVSCQSPVFLSETSLPEPDLMLLRPSTDNYKSAHPKSEDVFLVIEVSDSSLLFDRETKLPLYARAGIEEAWILNVPQKQLEVYRKPNALGYESKAVLTEGDVAPAQFPDAFVDVRELVN